jgi:hypothetical protein
VPELPADLAVLLRAARPQWLGEESYEITLAALVHVLSLHSDCPRALPAARAWLDANASRLAFNPASQRYEIQ